LNMIHQLFLQKDDMIRKFEYTSILGWSASRYDTFSRCKRQYFYQYYSSYDPEYEPLKINTLKGLTTVPLEIGSIAHEVISVLLKRLKKTTEPIDRDRFLRYVEKQTLEIAENREFAEVYYGQTDKVDAETEILPKVRSALVNLIESDRLQWLMNEALEKKEEWIIEPEGYGECRIDGEKAYCKVDFLFPVGDEVHIFDWKTGKRSDDKHLRQMRGYATWAHFHLGVDYSKIRTTVAYLFPEYDERPIESNEFEIEAFADVIREETEEMYEFCTDVEGNKPLPKVEFEMTDNLKICSWCNFRELCERD